MSLAIPDMFSHAVDTGDVVTTLVASLSLVVSIFALLAGQHREKRQENQRRRERDQDVSTKALTYLATFARNTSSPVSEEFQKGDFQDHYRARHHEYSAASMELEQLKRRLGRNDVKTLVDEAVELMATQMMTVRGIVQTMEAMSQAQRDNPDQRWPDDGPLSDYYGPLGRQSSELMDLHNRLQAIIAPIVELGERSQ
jgi:hypothetical protein